MRAALLARLLGAGSRQAAAGSQEPKFAVTGWKPVLRRGGAEGGGAARARADGAEMLVGEDASVVTIGEVKLDGVSTDSVGRLGFGLLTFCRC